jgi:hypothetical protein
VPEDRLNVNVNANEIKKAAKDAKAASAAAGKHLGSFFRGNPNARHQGRSSRSGGRQAFTGGLVDFLSRDEFTGRAGTAARAIGAMSKTGATVGGAIGLLLALMTVEEAGRIWMKIQQGAGFQKELAETVSRIIPVTLRETLPSIVNPMLRNHRNSIMATLNQQLAEANEQQRLRIDVLFAEKVDKQLKELLEEQAALRNALGFAGGPGSV